jgi:hypothetical protein
MKSKFFYIFITAIFLIEPFKLVLAGNFKIDLVNSTTIDTVLFSY